MSEDEGEDAGDRFVPDWQQAELDRAREMIANPLRFVQIPDRFEINEWEMMQAFCRSIPDARLQEVLDRAIHGAGAFRRFKDQVSRHDLWPAWDRFKQEQLLDRARNWCREQGLEWVEDIPPAATAEY